MGLTSTIAGYFTASTVSLSRCAYSAGQTFYALKEVSNYIFKSTAQTSPVRLVLPCLSIAGGLGINLLIRVPSIFKEFNEPKTPKQEDVTAEPLGYVGSAINYLLLGATHLTAFFDALNAHFGTVILSESIGELLGSTVHDTVWKEAIVQAAAISVALTALATFYSYDYKISKENTREIAGKLERREFSFNRNHAKTLAVSALNLIAAPVIAKFWTSPAIIKIPGAQKLLTKVGVDCITWTASAAAFINGLTTLPTTHVFFTTPRPKEFIETKLITAVRYATYTSTLIDSIATGLCSYIGMINTAKTALDLDPYGYIIAIAVPIGISAAIQNAMLIRPGYLSLVQYLQPKVEEVEPLLQNEDDIESNLSNDRISPDETITQIIKHDVDEIAITIKNDFYKDNNLSLLFATPPTDTHTMLNEKTVKEENKMDNRITI